MKYAELSDEAKARAREWIRRCEAESWDGTDNYDTLVTVLGYMGITCATHSVRLMNGKSQEEPDFSWSVSYCQGDGFVFHGRWEANKIAMDKLTADFTAAADLHAICGTLMALFLRHPDASCTIGTQNYGPGLPGMVLDECVTGDDVGTPLSDADEKMLKEQFETLAHWCYAYLRDDLDYRLSDEALVETIEANEYEFDEDGERV